MNEIKVIRIKFEHYCWECEDTNESYCYYECPALNKLLSEGWSIKDWKMCESNIIFILEKHSEFQ